MSDNLHFQFLDGTTIPPGIGSSGVGGFPFPIYNLVNVGGVSVGDGGTHPLALPLEVENDIASSHAREFWRGRTLAISTDLTYDNGDGGGPVALPIGNIPETFSWTRELDHIVSPERLWLYNTSPFSLTVTLHTGFGIVLSAPTFYMQLSITGNIIHSLDPGAGFSTLTATFDTYPFTVWYETATIVVTHFDLYWVDFWPYVFNGNPIYDTTTGLELQDPKL